MDNRACAANASAVPPAAPGTPSVGYPKSGNPQTDDPATWLGPYWHYALGEEMRNLIVAGGLVPNLNTLTQVRDAIQAMINASLFVLKVKVGSFSRDMTLASGTQVITGVGFEPKAFLFNAALSSPNAAMSLGFDDGTLRGVEFTRGSALFLSNQSQSIQLETTAGVDFQSGFVAARGPDGFTVNWVKTGAPTGTAIVNYRVIG